MSEFDFTNDSMLEMYLFESTTLLDQLDEILLHSEKSRQLSSDNINEIFRIMHTIKGSSAMMEFNTVSFVAHKLEDLFFVIRQSGVRDDYFSDLLDLVLRVSDFLKEEVDKIQQNKQLSSENDVLVNEVLAFLDKMNDTDEAAATPAEPLEDADISLSDTTTPVSTDRTIDLNSEATLPDEESGTVYNLHIMFTADCQMENIRAYMLLNILEPLGTILKTIPDNLNGNPDAASLINQDGFYCCLSTNVSKDDITEAVKGTLSVKTCSFIDAFPVAAAIDGQAAEAAEIPAIKKAVVKDEASKVAPAPQNSPKTDAVKVKEDPKPVKPAAVAAADPTPIKAVASVAAVPQPADDPNDSQKKASKQNLINVDLNKLDTLMDLVGEIVITESMVSSNPDLAGLELESFHKSARQLRKLTDELQGIVMSIRMVPISATFQKMHRIVRDMNKKLTKDVELILMGETTEVDKTIIDGIADPLMHLVRNAMDHGLEDRTARIAAGKDPVGRIVLSAQNNGGDIIISVSDNGKGLDTEVLLAKAKANGILTKPAAEMTEKEIFNLLTLPGFSTKEAVTEFSGRGVGMDVVKRNIEKIGGSVTIESIKGSGTNVYFKIPLTLAIIAGMEIKVGINIYTLPISNIRESFKPTANQLISDPDGNEMIMIRGTCYPIIRLHRLFDIENCVENIEDGILLLVDAGDHMACIFADGLVGKHQVVVKPLPTFLNRYSIKSSGIAGCTILGDGGISLILDAQGILNR